MHLHRALAVALALGCAFASGLPAASPFAGKWKFNPAKSSITGTTDSIAAAGPKTWKFTYGSFSWTVKADGTDQPTAFGGTVALKVIGPTNWMFTRKTNGIGTSTDVWSLSSDGMTMTRSSVGKHLDGTSFNDVVTFRRTVGDKGFEGTWVSTEAKVSWLDVVIADNGAVGITLTVPGEQVKIVLTFDGKDAPVNGPRIPPGMTTSTKVSGPRKLEVTTKLGGKVLDTETWEISADGQTFTYTEKDAGEEKATVQVYDKK